MCLEIENILYDEYFPLKFEIDEYAQQAMFLADEFIQFSVLKSVQNENTRKFKRCIIYVFISHGQCLKKFLQLFYITRILILGNLTHTILLISHIFCFNPVHFLHQIGFIY